MAQIEKLLEVCPWLTYNASVAFSSSRDCLRNIHSINYSFFKLNNEISIKLYKEVPQCLHIIIPIKTLNPSSFQWCFASFLTSYPPNLVFWCPISIYHSWIGDYWPLYAWSQVVKWLIPNPWVISHIPDRLCRRLWRSHLRHCLQRRNHHCPPHPYRGVDSDTVNGLLVLLISF